MTLRAKEISKLHRIITLAENLIAESPEPKRGRPPIYDGNGVHRRANGKRIRRTGNELMRFRKMLKAKRKRGALVADLARKYGISSAYIYQL
jgi:hypothetical protein